MQIEEFDDSAFTKMVDEFLVEFWQHYPSKATYAGIHEYDEYLDCVSEDAIDGFIGLTGEYEHLCTRFKEEDLLNADNRIDLEILLGYLKADPLYYQIFKRHLRDPSYYVQIALYACHILRLRDFAPKEQRYLSLIARLKEIPQFLIDAKDNMRRTDFMPAVWLAMAREMTFSAQKFFSDIVIDISPEIESLKNDMMAAGTLASKAFEDYLKFLDEELSNKPDGPFAAGKELYDILLKNIHMLPYESEEIEQIGLEYIDDTTRQIDELSRKFEPRKDWPAVIEGIKSDHPAPEELTDYYRDEVDKTRSFVLEKDLVSIPEGEVLEITETPPFARSILPYAAYLMPAPFESNQKGFFWVTPIDVSAPIEKQKEQLLGHSRPAIAVRTLHEGYPGHHLQLCHANRIQSRMRRIFRTSVFAEGWALYCEELMKEQGYYQDKRAELIQLKDQLWRACRVVIDVRLHSGRFGFDEAVTMLVEKARLEKYNAETEVKRYTQTPTQPMSYLIGKIEIERLLKDYIKMFPDLKLKNIHDRLLSFGTIPVALIRRSLPGTN
jgi:hypothetical protein